MPQLKIQTPDDGSTWPDDRLTAMRGVSVVIDGTPYPIVGTRAEGKSALFTVDTGADGPKLATGTATDVGTVV